MRELNQKIEKHIREILSYYEGQQSDCEPEVSLSHLIKASYVNEEIENETKFANSVPQIDP